MNDYQKKTRMITRDTLTKDILEVYAKLDGGAKLFHEPRERYTVTKLKKMTRYELQLHLSSMVISK